MTPFKIFFVGIVTFIQLANGTKHAVLPNASGGGRVVGTHHVESHTAYVSFRMSDYVRSNGWGSPTTFSPPLEVKALELFTGVTYGMYALDGFTISVSREPEAFVATPSHCVIPHLTLECPTLGALNPTIEGTKDKNLLAADMIVDSGSLYAKVADFGALFSRLDLKTPAADTEIRITATSFDGKIVREVYLKPGATIWFGNEWSGKFTGWKPNNHDHWMLNYLLTTGPTPNCECEPKPVKANCATNPPTAANGDMPNSPATSCGDVHKAYTLACSNSAYP